ncbi:hypothetical protein PMI01_02203 [Caulobacter sp. AP07]|nr:hypothetical protein PMI01_02203 [Caulobacter sp. AP07]
MVVAITTGGDCIVLSYRNLGDFIDGLFGEDSGLEVPNGTGPGIFAVRNCVVYGNPDEEEREPTMIEGQWVKLRDLSPAVLRKDQTPLSEAALTYVKASQALDADYRRRGAKASEHQPFEIAEQQAREALYRAATPFQQETL